MFSALCVVASIIRAYFVAVFETARHIINVGGRTTQPQPQPTISNCQAGCTETKRNTEMTLNTDCAGSQRRKLIKTPPESHMQPTVLLVVLLQPQLPAGDWYTGGSLGYIGTLVQLWWTLAPCRYTVDLIHCCNRYQCTGGVIMDYTIHICTTGKGTAGTAACCTAYN